MLVDAPREITAVHAFFRAGVRTATTASYQASFGAVAERGIGRDETARLLRRSVESAAALAWPITPSTIRTPAARPEISKNDHPLDFDPTIIFGIRSAHHGVELTDLSLFEGGPPFAPCPWMRDDAPAHFN